MAVPLHIWRFVPRVKAESSVLEPCLFGGPHAAVLRLCSTAEGGGGNSFLDDSLATVAPLVLCFTESTHARRCRGGEGLQLTEGVKGRAHHILLCSLRSSDGYSCRL